MKPFSLCSLALASMALLIVAPAAPAAEEVVLRYRGLGRTVAVADLATLAATGEAPANVAGLLNQVNQRPETLQSVLNHRIEVDVVVLDKTLNSLPGEWLLDQLGQAIRPASGEARQQALRSALVLSASDDGELTLLEVLQNYPTETVVLEMDQVESLVSQIEERLQPLSRLLGESILGIILRGGF